MECPLLLLYEILATGIDQDLSDGPSLHVRLNHEGISLWGADEIQILFVEGYGSVGPLSLLHWAIH